MKNLYKNSFIFLFILFFNNALYSQTYNSDYMPFQDNDEIITGFYEKNISQYPHTINDILSNLDVNYVYEVTKAAIGASLHFAIDYNSTVGIAKNSFSDKITVYPNPTDGKFYIDLGDNYKDITITLTDINDKTLKHKTYHNCHSLDLKIEEPTGVYFLKINSKHKQAFIKLIKK